MNGFGMVWVYDGLCLWSLFLEVFGRCPPDWTLHGFARWLQRDTAVETVEDHGSKAKHVFHFGVALVESSIFSATTFETWSRLSVFGLLPLHRRAFRLVTKADGILVLDIGRVHNTCRGWHVLIGHTVQVHNSAAELELLYRPRLTTWPVHTNNSGGLIYNCPEKPGQFTAPFPQGDLHLVGSLLQRYVFAFACLPMSNRSGGRSCQCLTQVTTGKPIHLACLSCLWVLWCPSPCVSYIWYTIGLL